MSPARQGTKRIYSRADRTRLKLVLRGRRLGWPLDEIKSVLDMYDSSDGELMQLEYTCDKIATRREQLKQQQLDIEAALKDMDIIEQRCKTRIEQLSAGSPKAAPG